MRNMPTFKRRGYFRLAIGWAPAACMGLLVVLCDYASFAQEVPRVGVPQFTLTDCIHIGLNNQAAIQVQIAAAGAAQQQDAIAQSYFYPQVDLQSRFTNASSIYTVALPNPITGPLADVVADSGAYFGIAKQAGSAVAQAAIDNPNVSVAPGLPSYNAARQAVLNCIAGILSYNVDLLGQNFLTTQVTLVQPLWTGGKIRYRREQAELGTRAAASTTWKGHGTGNDFPISRGPIYQSSWRANCNMSRKTQQVNSARSNRWPKLSATIRNTKRKGT